MKATECCVVVSQEQGEVAEFAKWRNFRDEPLDITQHREKMVKRNLEKEFKQAENPFRIAIVCAMWLTGFDVKCLATLYIDKPMQGHTLMQAIARVNRVGCGKKHGLIIDYNGMLKSLCKALATFAQGDRAGTVRHHHNVQGRSLTSSERPFSLANQWLTVRERAQSSMCIQGKAGGQIRKAVDCAQLFPRFPVGDAVPHPWSCSSMLTEARCKNASCSPTSKRERLADSGGLYLEVIPTWCPCLRRPWQFCATYTR